VKALLLTADALSAGQPNSNVCGRTGECGLQQWRKSGRCLSGVFSLNLGRRVGRTRKEEERRHLELVKPKVLYGRLSLWAETMSFN